MLKILSKMLRDERGFIATATALATAAIVGAVGAGAVGIVAASKSGDNGGKGGTPGTPENTPSVGSGSQDISREEMRKRGRAALISTSSQGVLDNAPTGRSQLLAN